MAQFANVTASATERLEELGRLWRLEREASRQAYRDSRERLDFAERVARGLGLERLEVDDSDPMAGGRALLWLRGQRPIDLAELRLGLGDPVLLWAGDPTGERRELGVLARSGGGAIGVAVNAEYASFLDEGAFNLDREAPEVTFERGEQALGRWRSLERGSPLLALRDVLLGHAEPRFRMKLQPITFLDTALDATQQAAVQRALAAEDVALIHGPPGTGKTRTLVEVVRQAVARGDRVLVTAASHTAVDNVAERLSVLGVAVVRLGHPARVSEAIEARTLDALVDASDARARARRWLADATELRRRVSKRRARGAIDRQEARELYAQARNLSRDARAVLDEERALQLARVRVVCATAAGVDVEPLRAELFDLVVLDEATQAVDPIALAALARGKRAVLAGDPQQLPPTVISTQAAGEGLSRTLFERLAARTGAQALSLLRVQYRMHEALMRFPSERMYRGELIAAPEVATQVLEELPGVRPDPLRPSPLCVLDCAGKGWQEVRDVEDPSTHNPEQAERTAREVLRLLSRGVQARDVALITPYAAQARRLRELLADAVKAGLEVGTVDGFQGREKEAVVVDLVRSNEDGELGFLTDVRRANVALTRARRWLLVVGDGTTLTRHPFYRALFEHAEATGAYLSAWNDDADPL